MAWRAERRAIAGHGWRDGLFHQIAADILKHRHAAIGLHFVPALIDIDPHAGAVAQRALDRADMGDIGLDAALADLKLEDIVTAPRQHGFGFVNILGGVAAGQSPCDGEGIAAADPGDQFADRHAKALARQIEQCGFHGAFGDMVTHHIFAHHRHRRADASDIDGFQQGRDIGING
jgi:hypothetical protein